MYNQEVYLNHYSMLHIKLSETKSNALFQKDSIALASCLINLLSVVYTIVKSRPNPEVTSRNNSGEIHNGENFTPKPWHQTKNRSKTTHLKRPKCQQNVITNSVKNFEICDKVK